MNSIKDLIARKKRKYNYNVVVLICIILLLSSCLNSKNYKDNCDLDWVNYNLKLKEKEISFCIPNSFRLIGKDSVRSLYSNLKLTYENFDFTYYSSEKKSIISIYWRDDKNDSFINKFKINIVDSIVKDYKEAYSVLYPGIVFTEREMDNYNNPRYLVMFSTRYPYKYDYIKETEKLDSIYSEFSFIKYYNFEGYYFFMKSFEKSNDFSFEEKYKILKSIKLN